MLDILFKKKVTEEQIANHFVHGIFDLVDQGFPEVAHLINEDPTFVRAPQINPNNSDEFLIIVIAGNLKYISQYFNDHRDTRLIDLILRKLATAFDMSFGELKLLIGKYQSYFSRINHPSKNTLYAMSKAVFYKYGLYDYQEEFFRNKKTPNPMLLKNLDQVMENFIWQWESIQSKYRITK